ncbi:MAG: DUF5615 family PIN-like protein [Flavisolibacter sp.]|nr:DUF5615 family PIN-like protein [Flavisolibacter sp.]
MKLLADESVNKPIVGALRMAGFDVVYSLEIVPEIDDGTILNFK